MSVSFELKIDYKIMKRKFANLFVKLARQVKALTNFQHFFTCGSFDITIVQLNLVHLTRQSLA
jgi:hypothetical protein